MFERLPDLLTFKECQQALQIGKNSLLKYLHSGELDGFKLGSRWRIYKYSLIEFLTRRLKMQLHHGNSYLCSC